MTAATCGCLPDATSASRGGERCGVRYLGGGGARPSGSGAMRSGPAVLPGGVAAVERTRHPALPPEELQRVSGAELQQPPPRACLIYRGRAVTGENRVGSIDWGAEGCTSLTMQSHSHGKTVT